MVVCSRGVDGEEREREREREWRGREDESLENGRLAFRQRMVQRGGDRFPIPLYW